MLFETWEKATGTTQSATVRTTPVRTAGPRPGDLLVAQEDSRYVLSVVPGEAQLWDSTSEPLVTLARQFAARNLVDCWVTRNGTPARLCGHRPADTGAPQSPGSRQAATRAPRARTERPPTRIRGDRQPQGASLHVPA